MHKAVVPRVSIGMPVYNGAKDISRAIDSLLSQTFIDFELIISDNASEDDTQVICHHYSGKDPRIRYFRQEKNQGPLNNFRFVWEQAKGDIFFWAPHDDWWHADFITSAVSALDSFPGAIAVMGTVHYIGRDGNKIGQDRPPYGLSDKNAFRRIRSYLERNVTDNLFYSVFRKKALEGVVWSVSLCPEKVVILHLIAQGPIVDGWGMEYFNQYSFKSHEQILETFMMCSENSRLEQQLFFDLLNEIQRSVTRLEYYTLAWLLMFKQHWYKVFAKHFLRRIGCYR